MEAGTGRPQGGAQVDATRVRSGRPTARPVGAHAGGMGAGADDEGPGALRSEARRRSAREPAPGTSHLVGRTAIGVVGACGGVGTSVFAAALAAAAARAGARTVLVDGARDGGGLDVLLGIEDEPGLRWPDLHAARGEVVGEQLHALLPCWRGVSVLSADRTRPATLPDDVPRDVLGALTAACDVVVHDVPADQVGRWRGSCAAWVVVARRDLASVAGAIALDGTIDREVAAGVVVRGPAPGRLTAHDVAAASGLDLWGELRQTRSLAAALERGEGPRLSRGARGLGAVAATVLAEVGVIGRDARSPRRAR